MQCDGVPIAAEAAVAPGVAHPPPPYDEATDIAAGIPCYLCEKAKFKTWGGVLEHVRLKHKVLCVKLRKPFVENDATYVKSTTLHNTFVLNS
jgi:hypothetical protein